MGQSVPLNRNIEKKIIVTQKAKIFTFVHFYPRIKISKILLHFYLEIEIFKNL